jgi:GT2 family glycosyltransferase
MRRAPDEPAIDAGLGIVVIGRNEGERLQRCIASTAGSGARLVYVDSGSTDGSVERVRAAGHDVVELDRAVPFTAARARNAGAARLRAVEPDLQFVQFVDGDCELCPGWLGAARAFVARRPDVVAVAGRLRERHPDASIYNRLCDLEWDMPAGEARACGGIAMLRLDAFAAAGGFREGLIAGEEPELCVRLRAAGGKIWRVADDMAWHDAAMTRFPQWWRRTRRAGHAYAEGAALHGAPPERHYVAERRRALLWGLALPLLAVAGALLHWSLALLLLAYPLQIARLWVRHRRERGAAPLARAFFLVLGRFPEALGVLGFWLRRWRAGPTHLIEYK